MYIFSQKIGQCLIYSFLKTQLGISTLKLTNEASAMIIDN